MNIEKEITKIKESLKKIETVLETKKEEVFETCNGLMWSNSQGKGTWDEAKKFAKYCRDGGYVDWRLPTISEFQNVFDYEGGKPKIGSWVEKGYFWSSTEVSSDPTFAWLVGLYNGFTRGYTKVTATYYVRCVREIEKEDVK